MEKYMNNPSAPILEHEAPPTTAVPPSYSEAMGFAYPQAPMPNMMAQPQHKSNVMPMPEPNMMPEPNVMPHPNMMPQLQQQNYMPPPGMVPIQQPTQQITTTVYMGSVPVGPKPMHMTCPVCHLNIKSTTVSDNTAGAHIACACLFFVGCCLCSCLPYCMDSCKSVRHTCPNCKSYLGTYRT